MRKVDSTGKGGEFLPFCLPTIGDSEKEEILSVLDSGWLTAVGRLVRFSGYLSELNYKMDCSLLTALKSVLLHSRHDNYIALGVNG